MFVLLFSFVLVSCDDDDDEVDLDVTDPTITITSPSAGDIFAAGDEVELRANIEDNLGLEEVRVFVTRPDGTNQQIEDDDISDFLNDNTEKDIELDIQLDANAAAGAYTIIVEAEDEQENTASESVVITVQ